MITFDSYKLDQVIDDRIEQALNFGDVYGSDLFDKEGKVGYHNVGFQPGHLIDVLQNQQYQISKLEDKISNLYNEINNLYKTKEERNE
jgi:hypothetical protein